MKRRFKRAVFAFFKEEILDFIGYNTPIPKVELVSKELNFTEIKTQIILDENIQLNFRESLSKIYERALAQAKQTLFEKCLEFIVVDEKSIINNNSDSYKAINVSLFIGKPNNINHEITNN